MGHYFKKLYMKHMLVFKAVANYTSCFPDSEDAFQLKSHFIIEKKKNVNKNEMTIYYSY